MRRLSSIIVFLGKGRKRPSSGEGPPAELRRGVFSALFSKGGRIGGATSKLLFVYHNLSIFASVVTETPCKKPPQVVNLSSRKKRFRRCGPEKLPDDRNSLEEVFSIVSADRPAEIFNKHVFSQAAMAERLPREVFERLRAAVEGREKLDINVAGIVAMAMKEWAVSLGATHYTHWFQPRTELTAEKHMAFLNVNEAGMPLEFFSGGELIQSEPDASSLPSGGMRTVFEARGYTGWDPSSPAFVVHNQGGGTLCIPSVFCSYDGTPLDMKTPLLKAIGVLEDRALRMLRLFGNRGVRGVHATVGGEQEFFLVDEALASRRPDLLFCGRSVMGCPPPKGQRMEDHYFGSIHPRVLDFMEDAQHALARLGVAVRTRHNEAAPGQFEFAPHFAEANLSADQNQIMMETLRTVARRHGFRLLLHEKPFAGLNGSGKHINISLQDSEGRNLLKPAGGNERRGLQFLAFLTALLRGMKDHGGLLRACVAGPGNVHRLGGHEAPPAIMSVFLGNALTRLLDDIEEGIPSTIAPRGDLDLGLFRLPALRTENTDRNRTAPVAFTGNKFEFRAPGASQSMSGPMTVLFALWARGMEVVMASMQQSLDQGKDINEAALDAVRDVSRESRAVRFEGNCYAPEWAEEARRRGLPVAHSTPEALALYTTPENRELLCSLGIMTDREIFAYHDIRLHQFVTTADIEMDLLASMTREGVLPALSRQIALEGQSLGALPAAFAGGACGAALERLGRIKEVLLEKLDALETLREELENDQPEEQAYRITDEAFPLMGEIRSWCDEAERVVAADLWPYPRYLELLHLA